MVFGQAVLHNISKEKIERLRGDCMNYVKLQKKILDNWLKNSREFRSKETDDSYIITDNGYQLFIIPKDSFYLDMKKLMNDKPEINLDQMLKIDGEEGHLTNEMKVIGKGIVVKIESENNHLWLDKKLLDRYEIKHGLHFTIPKKGPSLVWEDDRLCGVILPVNVKEDE